MNAHEQLVVMNMQRDFDRLKRNVSEWIIGLDTRLDILEGRILEVEQRLLHLYGAQKGR